MKFLKGDKTTSQDLSSSALSYTTDYPKGFKLVEILIKFSVAITETITITLDSNAGANYDTVLRSIDLVAETSFRYAPEGGAKYVDGDQIKIQCTNANTTGTAYVVVKSEEIG